MQTIPTYNSVREKSPPLKGDLGGCYRPISIPRNRILPYKPYLRERARELRKNPTPGERILWPKIRNGQLGAKFHRQVPIEKYIVDFYSHELMLAIELDGASHNIPEIGAKDLTRHADLERMGITILRFDERDIARNVDAVVKLIYEWIRDRETSP